MGNLGNVNWERGRLIEHQSFCCFAIMFCSFNFINEKQFEEYWFETFGFPPYDNQQVRRIAYLLGESISVVSAVFARDVEQVCLKVEPAMSYCSSCISDGFHGYFHDDQLLKRCPIHGNNLLRENLPPGKAAFRYYFTRLHQLFKESNPSWPWGNVIANRLSLHKNVRLSSYLEWRNSISATEGDRYAVGRIDNYSPSRGFSCLDIWLGRKQWHFPISKEISDLFLIKPLSVIPVIHHCEDHLAGEMAKIIDIFRLESALFLLKATRLLLNEPPPYYSYLSKIIESLRANHHHSQCSCIWGMQSNGGFYSFWEMFEGNAIRDYLSVLCPYRYAAEELDSLWLKPLPNSRKKMDKFIRFYTEWVALAEQRGLVKIISYATARGWQIPLPVFLWSSDVTQILNVILEGLVTSHVEEVKHWVGAVDAGIHPDLREYRPANVFLRRTDRGVDSVLVWPVGEGRHYGDEITNSWLSSFVRAQWF